MLQRERPTSAYLPVKKNPGFSETPHRRKKGNEIDFFRAKSCSYWYDTMSLYFGFQKSDKIDSCGFNPIQFVVIFIAADGN